jgi:hypothetical protein
MVYRSTKTLVNIISLTHESQTCSMHNKRVLISSFSQRAIIIAQLVEQGLLDYDERISTYWPEFAQGNKENVTLVDLVSKRRKLVFVPDARPRN